MYYDHATQDGLGWDNYIRAFGQQTRFRQRPPQQSRRMNMEEVSTVFGISRQRLHSMDKKELAKLYREMAQELHPDKGGDHDRFVELAAAYQEILRTKP
jgi:3-phenylpropionate/cinnamic acid dioxygenase small subunit